MARQSLVNLGYRVLSATNGEEALRLCDQQIPALAILDLVMPHMGGAAAAIQSRKIQPAFSFERPSFRVRSAGRGIPLARRGSPSNFDFLFPGHRTSPPGVHCYGREPRPADRLQAEPLSSF